MFEASGIMYADESARELEVRSAHVADDHVILVTFSTGETCLCDFTEMHDDVPAFAPLRDEKTLEDFRIDHGILTWCGGDIDISPTYLYEHSYEYAAHGELVSV
ncbi:DUF2442 domain-containing protein [Bifidobacterium leontopitheci]|uniref:DUF2442 domain-containing protein n=1 Tax=Bifidobacterium leontopitheci TaxID=2650774 RepID=A0A6I1GQD8_9BIFI|nr:DUF2442 domain-containing protein [Bifidobacterium leontopitheci]KAB7790308.1 hypothetical protein F7D09_1204 [Bifidobacterium leontopitheci]